MKATVKKGYIAMVNGKIINNGKPYKTVGARKAAETRYIKKLQEQGATFLEQVLDQTKAIIKRGEGKPRLHQRQRIAKEVAIVTKQVQKIKEVCACEDTNKLADEIQALVDKANAEADEKNALAIFAQNMNNR